MLVLGGVIQKIHFPIGCCRESFILQTSNEVFHNLLQFCSQDRLCRKYVSNFGMSSHQNLGFLHIGDELLPSYIGNMPLQGSHLCSQNSGFHGSSFLMSRVLNLTLPLPYKNAEDGGRCL